MGLVVDELHVVGADGQLDTDPISIALNDWAQLEATVTETDLADFLTRQAPGGLKDFEVSIKGGFVHVSATARVIVEVRATAICRLVLKEQRYLFVELDSVDGLAMAKGMIQGQLDQINPVLDAGDLPLLIELDNVQAEQGQVVLRGRARPLVGG